MAAMYNGKGGSVNIFCVHGNSIRDLNVIWNARKKQNLMYAISKAAIYTLLLKNMSFAVTLQSIECKSPPSLARSRFEYHHLIDIVSSQHLIHYDSNFDKLYFAKRKQFELLLTCNNFLYFVFGMRTSVPWSINHHQTIFLTAVLSSRS